MRGRGSVIKLDRFKKARAIHAVLADHEGDDITGKRVLDIGCGNGGIAEFFAENNYVVGVDVMDQRATRDDRYRFRSVTDEKLPFDESEFDIVISNHVIEHVSDHALHLDEIRRVLKRGGCAYLATPNKSSPIMEGHVGNDMVLKYREMAPLFWRCGFDRIEYGIEVARRPDYFAGEVQWARNIPVPVLKLMRPMFPSHIFILLHAGSSV